MKYSQLIGIACAIALVACCFMPWSEIVSKHVMVTGMHTEGTNFGRPGMMHIYLSVPLILFFAIPKIWAKRTNLFIAAINLAWAVRNFILLGTCQMGDCPEKKLGLYLTLILSAIIMAMTLLPKVKLPEAKAGTR